MRAAAEAIPEFSIGALAPGLPETSEIHQRNPNMIGAIARLHAPSLIYP